MPRYYLHTETLTRTTDDIGVELVGAVKARQEVIRTCGEMMRDRAEGFWGLPAMERHNVRCEWNADPKSEL